jgi:hypothetical protein
MFDRGALAMTGRASCLNPYNAGRLNHAALPTAVTAYFATTAGRGPGSRAFVTAFVPMEFDLLGNPVGRFFERKRDIAANVATLAWLMPSAAPE